VARAAGGANGRLAPTLTLGYRLLRQVFWPLYAPTAAALMEPGRVRPRSALRALVAGT